MSEPPVVECCDACGLGGCELADPTMHCVDNLMLCEECYREHLAFSEPAAYFEQLTERTRER